MDLPTEYNGLVDMVRQFLMEFIQDPKCENIEVLAIRITLSLCFVD
jgi:hypothetical protein